MWDAPFNQTHHKNKMGLSLTSKGLDEHSNTWYDIMYNEKIEDVDPINWVILKGFESEELLDIFKQADPNYPETLLK